MVPSGEHGSEGEGRATDEAASGVLDVLGTDRADLDGIVAEVVSDGYAEADGGPLVASAKVTMYKVTADRPDGQDG